MSFYPQTAYYVDEMGKLTDMLGVSIGSFSSKAYESPMCNLSVSINSSKWKPYHLKAL